MQTPLRRSLIICYLLWVSMCMCACVHACMHASVCDRNIPAAETWEGVTYKTLDSALSGDWGVLKCQNSNFLQTVTHSDPLHLSLTQLTALCCLHSYSPVLAFPFGFSAVNKAISSYKGKCCLTHISNTCMCCVYIYPLSFLKMNTQSLSS